MVAAARSTDTSAAPRDSPSRYDHLAAEHARLKLLNSQLTSDLDRATAVIQRLALDNERLSQQLAAAAGVVRFEHERRTRRPRDTDG